MATNKWLGNALLASQVNTLTPGSVTIGNVFTVAINSKAVSFTATANTVANVTAGLTAAINASVYPEFLEITAADNTTTLSLTARTAGIPFTATPSAATGAGTPGATLSGSVAAGSGPNDVNVAANWSLGAVPVATNDVVFDLSSVDALWNLDTLVAVALTSLTIRASYTGRLGLPDYNGSYYEYRPKYFQCLSTTVTVGDGPGASSGRIKLDLGATQAALTVYSTGSPGDQGVEALLLKGTHASNTLIAYSGSIGIAIDTGSVSTFATITTGPTTGGSSVQLRCGSGVTLTTVKQDAGTVQLNGACTTLTLRSGLCTLYGTGAYTTITVFGGRLNYQSSGTISAITVDRGAVDLSWDLRAKTISSCTLNVGATWLDPFFVATYSAGIIFAGGAALKDVNLDLGPNRTLSPT